MVAKDAFNLASLRPGNARRHRTYHGDVSFAFIIVVLNIAAFGPGLGFAPSQKLVRGAVS